MDGTFEDNECLLRAVWPPNRKPDFWVNGRLSSAALKDKKGLSVERTYDRSIECAVCQMRKYLQGSIASITVPACREADVLLLYKPTSNSKYHCEIHGSEEEVELNDYQAISLARAAKLVYDSNAQI